MSSDQSWHVRVQDLQTWRIFSGVYLESFSEGMECDSNPRKGFAIVNVAGKYFKVSPEAFSHYMPVRLGKEFIPCL